MYKIKFKKGRIWKTTGNKYSYYEAINRVNYLKTLGFNVKIISA